MNEGKFLLLYQIFILVMIVPALYFLERSGNLQYLCISLPVYMIQQFFGFNVFMHRYVAHRSFETKSIYLAIMGFLSVFVMVGSPLSWAFIHRAHHKYEDTTLDPHCPTHMGKIKSFFCLAYFDVFRQRESRVSIKDIFKHPVLSFFNEFWAVLLVATHLLVVGLLGFEIYAALILVPAFLHTLIVYYFLIIHLHTLGYRAHHNTTATNSWLVNFLSLGEGLHNNHHYKPMRWNTSMSDRQKDPVAWFINKIKD